MECKTQSISRHIQIKISGINEALGSGHTDVELYLMPEINICACIALLLKTPLLYGAVCNL